MTNFTLEYLKKRAANMDLRDTFELFVLIIDYIIDMEKEIDELRAHSRKEG